MGYPLSWKLRSIPNSYVSQGTRKKPIKLAPVNSWLDLRSLIARGRRRRVDVDYRMQKTDKAVYKEMWQRYRKTN